MRKWIVGLIVVALLAVAGWYAYQTWYLPQMAAAQTPTYTTTQVRRGPIEATVNATGAISPRTEVALSFRGAGRVQNVHVSDGQRVEAGQVLAELDTTELTLALAQARVSQEIAVQQLSKLETPPAENDVLAAQAAIEVAQAAVAGADAGLNAARANYNQLFVPISEDQRQVNEANLRQAEVNLAQAQSAYNQVKDQPNIGALPQSQQLQSATLAYELARAQAALTDEGPTNAAVSSSLSQIAQAELQLRQAQANLITAQNNLQTLLDGPSDEDLAIARAQVQQATLSTLQSENTLATAQLIAPFGGVISSVSIKPGELYGAGPAITMADLDSFHMDVFVDEVDVRDVAVGQSVLLRIDAFPDRELTGVVTEVSPTSQNIGGATAYAIKIVPDPTDAPLRPGMSATAVITIDKIDGAVLVPNRYITLNRDTGVAIVYKMVNGAPAVQQIELGLRNEAESQVLAGVDEGDELALITTSGIEQLMNVFQGN